MRILHVEDDPLDADLVRRRLADFAPHFELEQVATYDSALARLDRTGVEPPDLVLTDMRLPDGDGLSLLVHIRERALPSAVVVVTGSGDDETVVAALKAGADDYVFKRDDYLEHLPFALERALQRRRADVARHARPLKVLYAEDDPADIESTLRHFARHAGHIHLHVVSTAAETRRRLLHPNGRDEYHVVLLDYSLPGLDALEVLKELQMTRGLTPPLVLITGRGDEELALQALRLGASSYLVKNPGYLYKLPVELENAHVRAELTRREKALRESEERRRLAQRAARVGTWEWDIETGASVWSELIWELLGLDPGASDTTVERFMESIHPEDRDRVWRKVNEVIADGEEEYYDEFRLVRRDGGVLWVCSKGRLVRSADGRPERMRGVNIDITEHKLVEERVKERDQLLQSMFRSLSSHVVVLDREGVITYVSRSWEEFAGQNGGWPECVGVGVNYLKVCRRAADENDPAVGDIFEGIVAVIARERAAFSAEYPCHSPTERRWFLMHVDPMPPEHGGVVISHTNITAHKLAEEALKERENQLRLFVEHAPVAVAMFDREMRYLLTSRRWLKDNNLGEQEIIGRCHYDVVPDIPERWRAGHRRCLAGAIERCEEDLFEHPDGTFNWVRWEIRPWHAADGEVGGIIMFSETITERKRAEEELMRLTVRLFTLQDEERRRIARELHDGTAQNLFALTFNLARLQQHAAARHAELQQLVADTMTLGEEALRDIRTLSYLLHPPLLDQAGLVSALRWYVKGFMKRSGIHVDLIVLQEIGRLPPEVETALFRIVQESLTNVHRHSGSATAAVRLEMRQGEIVLQVKDEGRGMPPLESLGPADDALSLGVGLPGMRQRMRQLGGRLEFASGEAGTMVTAIVPFDEGDGDDSHPAG